MISHLMTAYAAVFLVIGAINSALVLKKRFSWFFLYELLQTVVLSLGVAVYFIPVLYAAVPAWATGIGVAAVAVDCWMTVSGREMELSRRMLSELKECTETELEASGLLALILSAPAYLSCLMLFTDKVILK